MNRVSALLRAALFLLLLPTALAAQAGTGTITGSVQAADGEPLAGASVTLGAARQAAVTDTGGRFVLRAVPAGRYTLRVVRVGHVPHERAVIVTADAETALAVVLAPQVVALDGLHVEGQRRRVASATRTETELLDLPQSIQVVGQEVIRQQGIIDLKDAVRNVSGVTYTGTYSGGYQYFSARGFWMSNVANYRRNGMLLPNFGQNYADNVESVEVLKGPSGILYGDVTPGGVINVVTKKPLAESYRRAELKVGAYGLARPALDLGGPLTASGSLQYRFNASYERSGSFRDQVESEGWTVAPSLAWRPGAATTWQLDASLREDDRVGDPGLISPDGTVAGMRTLPISRFLGEPSATYGYRDRLAVSTLEHWLGGRWKLRNVSGWNAQSRTPLNIYLGQVDEAGQVTRRQYYFHQDRATWSTALDLTGEVFTGPVRHQLLLGTDWMRHSSHTGRFVQGAIPGSIDLFAPTYGSAQLAPVPGEMEPTWLLTRRAGIYAQDQASFLDDRVHLLLGLRLNDYMHGWREAGSGDEVEDGEPDTEERLLSPRFGTVLKPAPWASAYASYSEAFEVNGFDWIDPSVAVAPTYGKQWELGIKGDFFRQRLGMTLAAFRIDKEDVYGWANFTGQAPEFALAVDEEGGYYTYGGATHRSRGVELDFHGELTDRLLVTGAAAYTVAEVVDDPAFDTGNWLANTPRETMNLWATYRPGGALSGVDLGGGVFYKGRFYGSEDNDRGGLVPANHTVDAAAGYEWGGYRAQLNVSNLTDRVSYLGGFGSWEPLWPRRVVLTLSSRF